MQVRAPYDLIAVGSGPAGQQAALQAAALGMRAAIVERDPWVGGAFVNSGGLPLQTLRAAIVELRRHTSPCTVARRDLTIDDLLWRSRQVVEHERDSVRDRLRRNGVQIVEGTASFVDPHTLAIEGGGPTTRLYGEFIVVAAGSVPVRPPSVDFDGRVVLDPDSIAGLEHVPRALTVVGASVVGLEFASMAAALGAHVTVVERRRQILDFVDRDLVEALQYHLRGLGVVFELGTEVTSVHRTGHSGVVTRLSTGEQTASDVVLYAAGRRGATEGLNLAAAGLEADERGRLAVDAELRTRQPHIFAAGDVVGCPGFTTAALDGGRRAALAAFGVRPATAAALPYAVSTIPELSFVGAGERELRAAGVPYVAGIARYGELSSGQLAGDRSGLLKLLVHAEERRILGVHIFGTAAGELVHIGQTAIAGGLGIDYLLGAVFNVPTFGDAYRLAALDADRRSSELDDAVSAAA